MIGRSQVHVRRAGPRRAAALMAVLAVCGLQTTSAQVAAPATEALRQQLEQRFEVLPLREGVALRPRSPASGVRSIEVADGTIAIDGRVATGGEVRDRLGEDAPLVIQLSYLDAAARRSLFGDAGAVSAPPTPSAALEPPAAPRSRRSGDRVRVPGSVTVEADELIAGDVVAIGGSARVFGEVTGDVVAVGGSVELGPTAVVGRDVTVIGGSLQRAPGARIGGETHEIGAGLSLDGWQARVPWGRLASDWAVGSGVALFFTLTRVAILCLLAAMVVLLGREQVELVGARAAAEPLKAGVIGVFSQLLFLPLLIVTIVVLVVTIIGIPLLLLIPFAVLALGIVALVGFTAVAYFVGRLLGARFGWEAQGAPVATVVGIVALLSPAILARLVALAGPLFPMTFGLGLVGTIAEYLAWTIGFGAVALARFGGPLPTSASSSPSPA